MVEEGTIRRRRQWRAIFNGQRRRTHMAANRLWTVPGSVRAFHMAVR